MRQGDSGATLFVPLDGILRVEVDGVRVAELGPGAVLGERAVIEGGRRTATLVAVTACRLAEIAGLDIASDQDAGPHNTGPLRAEPQDPLAVLSRAMGPPHFPITPADLRGDWTFESYGAASFVAEGFTITAREIPHKGGRTMGLRITDGGATIAYLSDHAPQQLGTGSHGVGEHHQAARVLAEGVELLVHDARYTADELPTRGAFGHAAAEYALGLAEAAGAHRVLLFHHDPRRSGAEVAELERRLARAGAAADVSVAAAREGSEIRLG